MKKWVATLGFVGLVLVAGMVLGEDLTKPVKVPAAQAAGEIFSAPGVKHNDRFGPVSNLALLTSRDQRFTAGVYKAAAGDFPIESYPEDEFCYFLTGSVKLTSADGTVMELKAGDAVVIPKGWKGRWTTPGYSKYYAVYNASK